MARQLHDESTAFPVKESDLPDVLNPDPEVTYSVRPLSTAKFRELQKKNTRMVPNKQTRQMDPELNAEHFADDLIDHVIEGWSGIVDKGQPAECSRANKL